MQPAAIIFDCDGTLADTMPAHYVAWTKILGEHRLVMSEDRFYSLGGWPTLAVARLLIQESGSSLDPVEMACRKEALFEESLDEVRAIEPVAIAVRESAGRLPIAVATGAVRAICERILRQVGLHGLFDAMVCAEDVPHHKPHPAIFLEAARQLGVAPETCLVYEDTDPGVEAARRAGMACRDVRDFYTPRRISPRSTGKGTTCSANDSV